MSSQFARRGTAFVAAVAVVGLAVGIVNEITGDDGASVKGATTASSSTAPVDGGTSGDTTDTSTGNTAGNTDTSLATTTTTGEFVPRTDVLVDPDSFGRPYGTTVPGVLTCLLYTSDAADE